MMADVGLQEAHCLRVDGGASTNDLLMQLQADLLQVSILCACSRSLCELLVQHADVDRKSWSASPGCNSAQQLTLPQPTVAQVDVERPDNLETTSLGAAYAAGIGAGIWTHDWVMQQRVTAQHGAKLRRTFLPQVCLRPA